MNTAMSPSRTVRRDSRVLAEVSRGAPTTTPRAYPEIKSPAVGIDTWKATATSGSNPIMMNSVHPIPKALTASASKEVGKVPPVEHEAAIW